MNREELIYWLIDWYGEDPDEINGMSDSELEEKHYACSMEETNSFLDVSGLCFDDEGQLVPDDNEWEDIFELK